MNISIKDALAGRQFPDAGAVIFDMMNSNNNQEDVYVWDMAEVSDLPSVFLNMCLGRLVKEKGVDFVKNRLRFVNINKSQALRILDYVNKISVSASDR